MNLNLITKNQGKDLVKQYAKLYPEYKKLAQELTSLIKSTLNKAGIEYIEIIGRAKNITSFKDKIKRKKYNNPLFEHICPV